MVHGLRHTFGSQMAMAGADPFAIMKAMGHTDMKTILIYVSLGKSHIREQVEKLNSISIPKSRTLLVLLSVKPLLFLPSNNPDDLRLPIHPDQYAMNQDEVAPFKI